MALNSAHTIGQAGHTADHNLIDTQINTTLPALMDSKIAAQHATDNATYVPKTNLLKNVVDYGADPTGAADSLAGILAAVTASLDSTGNQPNTNSGIYFPAGRYKLSARLDLSTLLAGGRQSWSIDSDAGAVIFGHGVTLSPGDTTGSQLIACRFILPALEAQAALTTEDGYRLRNIVASEIVIPRVTPGSSGGQAFRDNVVIDESGTPANGFFNNLVRIGYVTGASRYGINVKGNTGTSGYDVQGNVFQIGQVRGSGAEGISVQTAATENSRWNSWYIGVLENNQGFGFYDRSGATILHVANTNGNLASLGPTYANGSIGTVAAAGYAFDPGSATSYQTPIVVGSFSDGYRLNGKLGFVTDSLTGANMPQHCINSGPTAAAVAGGGAGTSPPAPVLTNASDVRGAVSFGTGTGPVVGDQCIVNFAVSFAPAPSVVITPLNASAAALGLYISQISGTGFVVAATNAPAASQANTKYAFTYHIIG